MPSPIAHIYHSQVFLSRHLIHDPGAFLRGTIFPDIRYPLHLDRLQTHRVGVSLSDVLGQQDPWTAGWLFHNWLDEVWADYFAQFGLDRHDHANDSKFRVLKLIDDDQLHRLLEPGPAERMAAMLMRVDPQVELFGVSSEGVQQWNVLIAELLRFRDALKTREQILSFFQLSGEQIGEIERHERLLEREKVWPRRVRDCRRVIEGLL